MKENYFNLRINTLSTFHQQETFLLCLNFPIGAIDSSGSVKTAGGIALNDTAPNNNTDARTNQACPDTYKYAKRDTRFRKHSLKEDACQVSRVEEMLEETEFAGKSDPNTYYNTTGRRIPLDKLAEYVELKAVEDIENDFYVSIFIFWLNLSRRHNPETF